MPPIVPIFQGGVLFGPPTPDTDVVKQVQESTAAIQAALESLRRLIEIDILTRAGANLATSIGGMRVAATGTAGPGTEVYRNGTKRTVAVIIRDRGGTAQTLFAARQSSMDPADGFSTSGTTGVTTETDPFLVLPNQAVYVRMSSTAVMVDVAILDPTVLLEK